MLLSDYVIRLKHLLMIRSKVSRGESGFQKCFLIRINISSAKQVFGPIFREKYLTNKFRFGIAEFTISIEFVVNGVSVNAKCAGIFRKLREREYNPELMRLYVVGGGSCLIKHFSEYDAGRVTILNDICATAKGYEFLAGQQLRRQEEA